MAQEEPLEPEAPPPPEESSNRMFIILALLLGGIFLVGLICIGAYAVFLGPQQIHSRQTQVAVVNGTNTQIVAGNTQVAAALTRLLVRGAAGYRWAAATVPSPVASWGRSSLSAMSAVPPVVARFVGASPS